MPLALSSNMKEEEKYTSLKLLHGSVKNDIKIRIFNIQKIWYLI